MEVPTAFKSSVVDEKFVEKDGLLFYRDLGSQSSVKFAEAKQKVLQLLHDYPELIAEDRHFVRTGPFEVHTLNEKPTGVGNLPSLPKNLQNNLPEMFSFNKEHWIFLFTDLFVITAMKKRKDGFFFKLKAQILLSKSRLIMMADNKSPQHSLQLVDGVITYTCTVAEEDPNGTLTNGWYKLIRERIKEFQKKGAAAVSPRKESVGAELRRSAIISPYVTDHNKNLKEIFENKELALYFREFLHQHFNNENLSFWLEVEEFQSRTEPGDLPKRAQEIFSVYLANGSELEVNVPAKVKKVIVEQLNSPTKNIFNMAQQAVWEMMATDCLPKFYASELYKDYKMNITFQPANQRRDTQALLNFHIENTT